MRRYLKRASSGNVQLLMNLVNLGEVYYRMIQLAGVDAADERMRLLRKLPIELVPVREPLALEAGRIKAQHRISFADAFAVATARLEDGGVVVPCRYEPGIQRTYADRQAGCGTSPAALGSAGPAGPRDRPRS